MKLRQKWGWRCLKNGNQRKAKNLKIFLREWFVDNFIDVYVINKIFFFLTLPSTVNFPFLHKE